jgi:hypothetical protein
MLKKFVMVLKVLLCAVFILQAVSCGTILYPKRIGQRGGYIDPAVCVMDGLCCLVFLVPGVIAFAVDFSNGTIYLPGGRDGVLDLKSSKKIAFDASNCTMADIQNIVIKKTGLDIILNRPDVKIYSFSSFTDMDAHYAVISPVSDKILCSK